MDKKEYKRKFEKDCDAHIEYINEQYKNSGLELIRSSDVKKLKAPSNYLKKFLGSVIIAIAILFFASVIFYLGHYDEKFGVDLICSNVTVECSEIPENTCPTYDFVCGDCICAPEFPEDININFINGS